MNHQSFLLVRIENFGQIIFVLTYALFSPQLPTAVWVCDMKMANILAGIQSHSSTFPCHTCNARSPLENTGDLRKIGDFKRLSHPFLTQSRKEQKKASSFECCMNHPLLPGKEEDDILDLCPPCELHILLGICNKLADSLDKTMGENKFFKWLSAKAIVREDYFGECMEGRQCVRILKMSEEIRNFLPENLKPFAKFLEAFNSVRQACFGMILDPEYH